MSDEGVTVTRAADRPAPMESTPGMVRQEAFDGDGVWIGTVRTAPLVATGWHHHAEYESWIYVLAGQARMEFGPRGERVDRKSVV